ncbi:MAG TPA: hypothetical protein DD490_09690 [Acidobacteria bacterium]|nr:hypothetical protein [Acidobacteriota bacterium]
MVGGPQRGSKQERPAQQRVSSATRPSGPRQVMVRLHQNSPSRVWGIDGSGAASMNIPFQRSDVQQVLGA